MSHIAGTSAWRDIAVIHRLEYPFPVSYVCYSAWGACFAVDDVRQLLNASVLAAFVVNLLLIMAVLALNTAVDIRTDGQHQERSYLAIAVLRFGRDRVLRWVATEMAAALALAVLVSAWSGRWFVAGIAAIAIGLHLLYNVEPVHLKRRSFAGPVAFSLCLLILPSVLSYSAARADFDARMWPIFIGLGILAVGRVTWWSVPDVAADAATGMTTPTVRYGIVRAVTLSCLIMLAGLILFGCGLWWRYGLPWALLGATPHGFFLGRALALLRRPSEQGLPSSVRMRKQAMPLVAVGDVVLVVILLVAH